MFSSFRLKVTFKGEPADILIYSVITVTSVLWAAGAEGGLFALIFQVLFI